MTRFPRISRETHML